MEEECLQALIADDVAAGSDAHRVARDLVWIGVFVFGVEVAPAVEASLVDGSRRELDMVNSEVRGEVVECECLLHFEGECV